MSWDPCDDGLPVCEQDDYGTCLSPTNDEVITTINLSRAADAHAAEQENVFLAAGPDANIFDSIMGQCRSLGRTLNVHELVVFMLLESQNWNTRRLIDTYLQLSRVMLSSIGIDPASALDDPSLRHPAGDFERTCAVCFDDFPGAELWCLPCGHAFCGPCWQDHTMTCVDQSVVRIPCLQSECPCKVPPSSVLALCGQDVYTNFLRYMTDVQVNLADSLTNCPNPPCSRPLALSARGMLPCHVVKCGHCGEEVCTHCHEASHAPASCEEKRRWGVLTGDDIMTQRLLGENFKICPNCKAQIEKNGGCYVMKCWKCQHIFCWACFKPWAQHTQDHWTCPYYKEADDPWKKKVDDIDAMFLERYNTPFLKKVVLGQMLRDKRTAMACDLARKTRSEGDDTEEIAIAVRELLDEIYWATQNLRWAQVHLFCQRYEQVKGLPGQQQLHPTVPGLTPHQILFERSAKDLDEMATLVDKRIKELIAGSADRLSLRELVDRKRSMREYRKTLLKHCDPQYRENAEWIVAARP
jgi:hypothetical protein